MPRPNPAVADSCAITVRVPIVFRRRGGRKRVATPDGSPVSTPTRSRVDSALVKAVARAFRWQKLIETGVYVTIEEIAAAEKINDSYVGRVLRLTLLEPGIVESILDGRQPPDLQLSWLLKPFPLEWGQQVTRMRFVA